MNLLANGIMAVGAFMGVFFSLLIIVKKHKCSADYCLAAVFVVMGFAVFLRHLEMLNRDYGCPFPWLVKLSIPFLQLHGLSLWFYTKSLTSRVFRLKVGDLLHFIPFLVVVVALSVDVYLKPSSVKATVDITSSYSTQPVVVLLILISNVFYYIGALRLLSKRKDSFSRKSVDEEPHSLRWLSISLKTSLLTFGMLGLFNYADYLYDMVSTQLLERVAFICISFYIIVIGFYGISYNSFLRDISLVEDYRGPEYAGKRSKDLAKECGSSSDALFVERLQQYMELQKPFTKHELTLADLSTQLGISSEYLSNTINGRLGKNFFEFINAYRIAEFKRICVQADHRKYTLSAIASECGFNSRATFNRVFKNSEGISPSEYLTMIEEKVDRKPSFFEKGMIAV